MSPSEARAALVSIVGAGHVLYEPEQTAAYETDERRLYQGRALAVVRPADRHELQAVVQRCAGAGIAMVPHGGNTGYCGGATPDDSAQQLVISLERLQRVIEVDVDNSTLTVEAGVVLAAAQAAAAAHDLLLPLSMGSEGSCQIGGNLSTNAGGLAVLRYGTARDLVLGLEVVLPDGRCLSQLSGLRKDNTGYDLKQLFIGAEGTLGIISAASLKLFPAPRGQRTAFVALPNLAAACTLLAAMRRVVGDNVTSFEYLGRTALELTLEHHRDLRAPFDTAYEHHALIEWNDEASVDEEAVFGASVERGEILDAVLAHSAAQRASLWRLRESIPAAEKRAGGSIKHDVALRLGAVARYVEELGTTLRARWPTLRLSVYGHVGDGNVHFNVLPPREADAGVFQRQHAASISEIVHEAAHAMGGSFSAEHGVGKLKRELLARYAEGPELDLMRVLKAALDPQGLMNPGKLL